MKYSQVNLATKTAYKNKAIWSIMKRLKS